jgi:hypothetical protein
MRTFKFVHYMTLGIFALSTSACSTFDAESVEPWQGKVWRAVISDQLVDTTKVRGKNEKWALITQFDEKRDQGIRMARAHSHRAGTWS